MGDSKGMVWVSEELKAHYLFRLPRAYMFADYIWPGLLMSPERVEAIKDIQFRPTDILIASYPKSGTTWVSEVVSAIVHGGDTEAIRAKRQHERVPWLELDNDYLWVRLFHVWQTVQKTLGWVTAVEEEEGQGDEKPRVWFTHLPLELLPKSALDGGCRVIYVSRNAKDNAVSFFHFHQMARFLGQQKTTWDEFFPLYASGDIYCGSWFEHVLSYWNFSRVNRQKVLFLKYEEMKKDLPREVTAICQFLDLTLDEESKQRVIEHCTFDAMKDNKMANREGVWLFNQSISKFMRKGVVGDWKNYFTVAQNDAFNGLYERKMRDSGLEFEFNPCSNDSKQVKNAHDIKKCDNKKDTQDKNKGDKNKEGKDKEENNKEDKNKEDKDKEDKNKEGKNKEDKNKEDKNKEGKDKEDKNKEDKNKKGKDKEDKDKEGKNKEDKNKEDKDKEDKNKKGKDKEDNNKEDNNKEDKDKQGNDTRL